jgi:hypothetical protein
MRLVLFTEPTGGRVLINADAVARVRHTDDWEGGAKCALDLMGGGFQAVKETMTECCHRLTGGVELLPREEDESRPA